LYATELIPEAAEQLFHRYHPLLSAPARPLPHAADCSYAMQFRKEEVAAADPPQYEENMSSLPSAFAADKPLAFTNDDSNVKKSRIVKRTVSSRAGGRPSSAYVAPERYGKHTPVPQQHAFQVCRGDAYNCCSICAILQRFETQERRDVMLSQSQIRAVMHSAVVARYLAIEGRVWLSCGCMSV
jgi:hypothetical protein